MNNTITRHFGVVLGGLGLIGLTASFWQTAEKVHFSKNPDVSLSCNLNPIIDCGSVLDHPLSSAFGVPNSLIGVVMFSCIALLGGLIALGIRPNKNMKAVVLFLVSAVFGFAVWFFVVSLYEINKACIFCMFIWAAAVPMFVYSWAHYGRDVLGKINNRFLQWKLVTIAKYPDRFVVATYAFAIALFLIQFRDYYFGS